MLTVRKMAEQGREIVKACEPLVFEQHDLCPIEELFVDESYVIIGINFMDIRSFSFEIRSLKTLQLIHLITTGIAYVRVHYSNGLLVTPSKEDDNRYLKYASLIASFKV